MSCRIVRPLLTGLAFALVLALATPAHAGPRDQPATPSVSAFIPPWVATLLEKIGWHIDTGTAAAPAGGNSTPSDAGSSGDIGLHIDPNG